MYLSKSTKIIFLKFLQKLLFLLLCILLYEDISFSQAADTIDYFPIKEGNKYRYCRVGGCNYNEFPSYNKLLDWQEYKNPITINGNQYYYVNYLWWNDTLRKDENGNLVLYYQNKDQLMIKFDAKVGEKWSDYLNGVYEPWRTNYIMESRNDSIITLVGTFKNCLRVYFRAGYEVEVTHWYAPNVGLVFVCSQLPRSLYEAEINGKVIKPVGVEKINDPIENFTLYQNYPNPFNPETVIKFELKLSGNVSLKIYDESGREIKQLINNYYPMGGFESRWDGTDQNNNKVASGMYLYRLKVNNQILTKKLLLTK